MEQLLLHVAPPYFYSSPERTNLTLNLQRAFFLSLGTGSEGVISWIFSLDAAESSPLDVFVTLKII